MNKKAIITVACCAFFATALVVTLYAVSDKIVHTPQSFLRTYPSKFVERGDELDLKYNSYYYAGASSDHIYLGNASSPLHMVIVDYTLKDTSHVALKIDNVDYKKLTLYMQLKVEPPYFYLMDGLAPGLFRGKIGEWVAKPFMFDSAFFSQSVPIGGKAFAIRTKSRKTMENVLGKVAQDTPHVKLNYNLLQKQIDGVFCTDGVLNYSSYLQRIVYTYYYRNEFIVYDTNMNLQYRGNTLDTFRTAQIKLAKINSEEAITLASKPKYVNKRTCVYGNYLFIHSNVMAKNDIPALFESAAIIDAYDLRDNKYRFSFYIYNENDSGPREFQILNDSTLIVLRGNLIVKSRLNPQQRLL